MPDQTLNKSLTGYHTNYPSAKSAALPLVGYAVGLISGAATQLLFLYTALNLFFFLRDGASVSVHRPWLNLFLALFFAWPHSLLLVPSIQKRIKTWIPGGLMGCVHCFMTCVSLLCMFALWTRTEGGLWHLTGSAAIAMQIGFYGSWLALFYSLYLTGLGYQTGLTQWLYWARKVKPPRREFVQRGAYKWLRHPVYLSFLGLIWFTPDMTWDHVILTVVWTIYIFVGSYAKDRRLLHFIGEAYTEYARKVPGYPLIGFGPLGRWK